MKANMNVNVSKINSGVIAGAMILCLGIVTLIMSFQYSYSGIVGPGPGFFPFWLSLFLIILAPLYMYESFKEKNTSNEEWPKGESMKRIIFIFMALILFLTLFILCGFIVAGIFFLALLFYKEYKWYTTAMMSVGITAIMYVVFDLLLKVYLPTSGILF